MTDKEQHKLETINRMTNNLANQVSKILHDTNEKSIKTRYRYAEATERFCRFAAEEYHLQKFQNVKEKHIIAYTKYMQTEKGYSAATVKNELAGIRFYYSRSGGKNILPTNNKLDLQQRAYGQIDRAWNPGEIKNAIQYAKETGNLNRYYEIKMASTFGLRLEEVIKCQTNFLKDAIHTDELYTKGKNGQERYVQLETKEQQQVLREVLQYSQKMGKTGTDKIFINSTKGATAQEKKAVQNWMQNHRGEFQDQSREWKEKLDVMQQKAKESGVKIKTETLTFHGLRYFYAQKEFQRYIGQGCTENQARRKTSEQLGHHREAITKVYLSKL